MKNVQIINLHLTAVNQELALFNCENSITGVIHTVSSNTTVVLDGGYVLGQYGCVHKALDELSAAYVNLHEAEKESGNYASYKNAFNAGAATARRH